MHNFAKNVNLKSLNADATDFDAFEEELARQELRQRMRRAESRSKRREHHLAKKNESPNIGDLLAPGVPSDPRLVMHTSSYDYIIGARA